MRSETKPVFHPVSSLVQIRKGAAHGVSASVDAIGWPMVDRWACGCWEAGLQPSTRTRRKIVFASLNPLWHDKSHPFQTSLDHVSCEASRLISGHTGCLFLVSSCPNFPAPILIPPNRIFDCDRVDDLGPAKRPSPLEPSLFFYLARRTQSRVSHNLCPRTRNPYSSCRRPNRELRRRSAITKFAAVAV